MLKVVLHHDSNSNMTVLNTSFNLVHSGIDRNRCASVSFEVVSIAQSCFSFSHSNSSVFCSTRPHFFSEHYIAFNFHQTNVSFLPVYLQMLVSTTYD